VRTVVGSALGNRCHFQADVLRWLLANMRTDHRLYWDDGTLWKTLISAGCTAEVNNESGKVIFTYGGTIPQLITRLEGGNGSH